MKFVKAIQYFNSLINQVEVGSKEYKLLCLAKYKYIQDI
jgi:hypothetical protein